MSHALVQVYVHIVFHVKNNSVLIRRNDRKELYEKIEKILLEVKCIPLKVNGIDNHVHILCSLARTVTLADIVENVKKYSTMWLKQRELYYEQFAWQTGYSCFSVSVDVLSSVERYIERQEQHHATASYEDEMTVLFKKCGIRNGED